MGLISNGTTIFDNGSMASGFGGSLNFISKQTASASASIEFTSGIDSTYKEYIFYFVNMHPQNDGYHFNINFRDGGSLYDAIKTTTYIESSHDEADTYNFISYVGAYDLAQSTADQYISYGIGNGSDESTSGYLHLFNPSSTTYVKHFISNINGYNYGNGSTQNLVAGYCNTTSAIDGVQFKMSSGNIDAGETLLFGVN